MNKQELKQKSILIHQMLAKIKYQFLIDPHLF